jgi:putative DNA methylase
MSGRRLIEEKLPLKEVNAESAREKSLRHGHISTMHLWWARRPLAMSRAVVFGTLLPDPGDKAKRKEILSHRTGGPFRNQPQWFGDRATPQAARRRVPRWAAQGLGLLRGRRRDSAGSAAARL